MTFKSNPPPTRFASSFDRQGRPTPAKQSINSPSPPRGWNISFRSSSFLFSLLGTLVFWVREAYHIFPFRRLWSDLSWPRRFFSRDSRLVSADYAGETPLGRRKGQWDFLIKGFDTRNIRHRGEIFYFYFFFLIAFFSAIPFLSVPPNSFARIFPHIYSCRSGFFPVFVCL